MVRVQFSDWLRLAPPLISGAFLLRTGNEGEAEAKGLGQTFGSACLAKAQPRKQIQTFSSTHTIQESLAWNFLIFMLN